VLVARAEPGKELAMWEALREGIDEEMTRDPTVCLMGELALVHGLASNVRSCST
jgi:pyruvate/2-oxoglutarate/acetoin dehydrogenase E1 component